MRKKVWVLATAATVALAGVASVAVVQANSGAPADAATISPPAIPSFTPRPCPSKPESTPEVLGCAQKRLLETDKEINRLNASVFSDLSEGPSSRSSKMFQRKFAASHRAWLAYRDVDCPNMWAILEEGSIFPLAVIECAVTLNRQRIKNLRAFLRFPEG
jgi:uncharacterized protein YecT (DUF1311 family)